jgi:8-oxo-dGTP pyrophosphatase MutT (NUDIX family)
VLLTRRTDDGTWCLPAGAAEPRGSFAATAIGELKEKADVTVVESDLIPFATLSEAELHTIIYPNGDEAHCSRSASWPKAGTASPSRTVRRRQKTEFADLASPPSPIHRPTAQALELLNAYLRSGRFQLQ